MRIRGEVRYKDADNVKLRVTDKACELPFAAVRERQVIRIHARDQLTFAAGKTGIEGRTEPLIFLKTHYGEGIRAFRKISNYLLQFRIPVQVPGTYGTPDEGLLFSI